MFAEHYGMQCNTANAASLLLESWEELSESAVLAGWDYGEEIDVGEDDGDSDREFKLSMSTESDDEENAVEDEETEEEISTRNHRIRSTSFR